MDSPYLAVSKCAKVELIDKHLTVTAENVRSESARSGGRVRNDGGVAHPQPAT